jgi:hypothetical protein
MAYEMVLRIMDERYLSQMSDDVRCLICFQIRRTEELRSAESAVHAEPCGNVQRGMCLHTVCTYGAASRSDLCNLPVT